MTAPAATDAAPVSARPAVASPEEPTYDEVCAFLYTEARLADAHDYDAWESLWTADASYWVPANGEHTDPTTQISIVYDNRARIATRIRQLNSGKRFAQTPRSQLARSVTNVEVLGRRRNDAGAVELDVTSVFVLVEWRLGTTRTWAGRVTSTLRVEDGALALARKKTVLINSGEEVPTMAFLI